MMHVSHLVLIASSVGCIAFFSFSLVEARYTPDWASIDSRPLPSWYDDSKFGIFIHWSVWAAASFGPPAASEAAYFQFYLLNGVKETVEYMAKNYPPDFTYPDFAAQFKAEFYDPNRWAELFEASGAKYIVFTSKHHEGWTNWPSKYSWNWNSMDVGPHRDIVGELATAIRNRTKLHFGLYHSMYEWLNPLFIEDRANKFTTQKFVERKTMPELYELVQAYKPDVIWSDGDTWGGDWTASPEYWNSTNFLAWLYNDSPVKDTVVVNDRWGTGAICHHGGFFTCTDNFNPGVLQPHKWENCMTMDAGSWGYRRQMEISDVRSMQYLTAALAETISCGGNLLLNVGPTGDGRIVPIFEERLRQMGEWLKVNGEAVYGSQPWTNQNDTLTPNIWYTSKKDSTGVNVYTFMLQWPSSGFLTLMATKPTAQTTIMMLGLSTPLKWTQQGTGMRIQMPALQEGQRPCEWAWILKIKNLA